MKIPSTLTSLKNHPKPLYYNHDFLVNNLEVYQKETGGDHESMDPDEFVRWIFPRLLDYRKAKYQAIAKQYGYTVQASDTMNLNNENELIDLVAKAIESE